MTTSDESATAFEGYANQIAVKATNAKSMVIDLTLNSVVSFHL